MNMAKNTITIKQIVDKINCLSDNTKIKFVVDTQSSFHRLGKNHVLFSKDEAINLITEIDEIFDLNNRLVESEYDIDETSIILNYIIYRHDGSTVHIASFIFMIFNMDNMLKGFADLDKPYSTLILNEYNSCEDKTKYCNYETVRSFLFDCLIKEIEKSIRKNIDASSETGHINFQTLSKLIMKDLQKVGYSQKDFRFVLTDNGSRLVLHHFLLDEDGLQINYEGKVQYIVERFV